MVYELGITFNFLAFSLFIDGYINQPKSQDLWLGNTSTTLGFVVSPLLFTSSNILLMTAADIHATNLSNFQSSNEDTYSRLLEQTGSYTEPSELPSFTTSYDLTVTCAFNFLKPISQLLQASGFLWGAILYILAFLTGDTVHSSSFTTNSTSSEETSSGNLFDTLLLALTLMHMSANLSCNCIHYMPSEKQKHTSIARSLFIISFMETLTNACMIITDNFTNEANEESQENRQNL